jgi:hypothetical protein
VDVQMLTGFVVVTRERDGTPVIHRSLVYPTWEAANRTAQGLKFVNKWGQTRIVQSWVLRVNLNLPALQIVQLDDKGQEREAG